MQISDAVGALATMVALVELAEVAVESQEKVSPLLIVAINKLPKLSNDHKPGAVTMSPEGALFQAEKEAALVTSSRTMRSSCGSLCSSR